MNLLRELYEELWQHGEMPQEFDSAETSLNQTPSTFKVVDAMHGWKRGAVNADIGGGKEFKIEGASTHKFTVALQSRGVINVVYDPFNRSFEHNEAAAKQIRDGGADTVTVNNVLNVIKEPAIRERVIMQAANAIKPNGMAYFLIYQGNQSGEGKDTKKGRWQNNMKADEYMAEIHKHFRKVTKKSNLILASK